MHYTSSWESHQSAKYCNPLVWGFEVQNIVTVSASLWLWRWRRHVALKCLYPSANLHGLNTSCSYPWSAFTWNIRSGDRIPVGAKFSAPVESVPRAYPASCTMGTGSFVRVKRPGRGADHPPQSKCRGHETVGIFLYSPSGPQWPVIGKTFTFTLINIFKAKLFNFFF